MNSNSSRKKNQKTNTQLSIFNHPYSDKKEFLIVGNQKSMDKFKEIDYLTEIYYQSLH